MRSTLGLGNDFLEAMMRWLRRWWLFRREPGLGTPVHEGPPRPEAPYLNPGPLVDVALPVRLQASPRPIDFPPCEHRAEKLFELQRLSEVMLRIAKTGVSAEEATTGLRAMMGDAPVSEPHPDYSDSIVK